MEQRIKYLKISLIIEIFFALGIGGYMGLFLGVIATDSPKSTEADLAIGALAGFCVFALPVVVVSALSIIELARFPKKKKTIINFINTISLLILANFSRLSILLSLLAIWQIYLLLKMQTVKKPQTSDSKV